MRLYKQSLGLLLSSRMAYRLDFFFTFTSIALWSLASTLFIILLYGSGGIYPEWQFYEILVFLGLFNIFVGIARMLFNNLFEQVQELVRAGELELILTKPVNEIYLLLSRSFEYEGLGSVLVGIGLFITGLLHVTINLNPLLLLFYFLATLLFYFSQLLFMSTIAIRFIQVDRIQEVFENLFEIAEYPKNLFPNIAQITFTILFPLFIFSYYPASAVLGYEVQYPYLVIVSCVAFFFLTLLFWKQTIKYYTGAGG